MKNLGWILFIICMIIGAYICNTCELGIMILYYVGALCFSLFQLFKDID